MPKFASPSCATIENPVGKQGSVISPNNVPQYSNPPYPARSLHRRLPFCRPHAGMVVAGVSVPPPYRMVVCRLRTAARTACPDARAVDGSMAMQPLPVHARPAAARHGICRNSRRRNPCGMAPQTALHTADVCRTCRGHASMDGSTEYGWDLSGGIKPE